MLGDLASTAWDGEFARYFGERAQSLRSTAYLLCGDWHHAEDITQLSEIIPALKRALDENAKGRPAFLEFICSHHPVHGGWVRPGAGGGH